MKKISIFLMMLCFACFGVANAQTSLFSENFEGGSMPTGWTTDGSGTWRVGSGDYSSSTGAGMGTYNALITHGATGDVTKLITPEIDLSSVTSAVLSFMHVQRSWAGDIDYLKVYYRTSSTGTWTQLVGYTDAVASWTTEEDIVLPNTTATYQLAFEYTDNYGYGVGLDQVVISVPTSCLKPAGLAATPNGQSATLTWNGDASSYHVAYSTDGTANPDDLTYTTVTTNSYTKDNLAIDTDYYFWVRAICSATEQSVWVGPVSVHIGYCVPAPISVDNNGISNVTFGIGDYVVNNETPKATYADYSNLVGAVQVGVEATIAITFKTSYTYNTYVWVDLDNSLTFDADEVVCYGESTNSNPTTLTLNFTIPADQTLGDFRLRIGSADSGLGSDPTAANPCYTGSYGCFQDYTLRVLEAPACLMPTGLAVSNISNEDAVVTWTAGGENQTSWNLQYKAISETRWNTVNNLTTATYTLNRLEAGTVYEVQVQGNCGSEGLSDWTNSATFTTALCAPEDMCELSYECVSQYPSWYGAAINVVDAESGVILATWTQNNASTGVTTGTLAVCDGRQLSFEWVAGSYDSYSGVIESYAVYDAEGNEILSGTSAMTRPFTYTVNCPTCFKPTNLEATNVGAESAVLNWEGTSTSYVLQYRSAEQNINMAEWHQIGEDVTATATETTYTFDLSDYEGEGYVAIRHYNVTNMYFLDVDNITVTDPDGTTVLVSADGTSIPSDWTNQDVDGDGYSWSTSLITGYFVSQSYDNDFGPLYPDNWLIIPVSNLGGTLSFTAKGQDASFPSEIFGVFVTTASLEDALEPVAAGSWSNEITTTNTSYSITGLTANTPYEWKVKGVCGANDESSWATSTFSTIELGAKNFVTEGNWNVADNWEPAGVPTIDDKVIISANATIPAGVVATAKNITLNGGTLTIADGGQLKQNGNVELIMEKEIAGYGTGDDKWYLIASPLTTTRLTFVQDWSYVNALTGNYDLYTFDPTADDGLEWINYRFNSTHADFTSGSNNPVLVQQKGYLYAHKEGIPLQFEGSTAVKSNNNVLDYEMSFDETSDDDFNGWVLVGNPYTCDATISYIDDFGEVLPAVFYKMNDDGDGLVFDPFEDNYTTLPPLAGAFVNFSETGKIQFSSEIDDISGGSFGKGLIGFKLSQGRNKVVDQGCIRFGRGYNLKHLSFRRNSSKVYMPVDGNDYAVVYTENQGEMPVSFKAENNGTYTLNFNTKNVELGYLHLIDNMTGNDVDLLATPSYTFEANTTDYANRFKLVFASGNADDTFAFFSNGSFVINNEGNATLQVIDVTGRILSSENINGCTNVNVNATPGVYMLRLVNGDNVKVQKVVVR